MHGVKCNLGGPCLHEKTCTDMTFILGWLFHFLSCLHYDWVISYLVIWRYTLCWINTRVIQNRKHYACATCSSLPAHQFHYKWLFRVNMIRLQDFVPEWNSRPGTTTGVNSCRDDLRHHDIFWWYHVKKYRTMRGNQSELVLAWKSPQCHVNTPYASCGSVGNCILGSCGSLESTAVNHTLIG